MTRHIQYYHKITRVQDKVNKVNCATTAAQSDHILFSALSEGLRTIAGFVHKAKCFFFHAQLRTWGYRTFSCSTQLSTKFILLINVKMPTSFTAESFTARKKILLFFTILPCKSNWNFMLCRELSWTWKKVYNHGTRVIWVFAGCTDYSVWFVIHKVKLL